MSRDIPVIFSGPMVRALLNGRKTMTRRLAWGKPMPGKFESDGGPLTPMLRPSPWQKARPGDRLWVRENYFSKCGEAHHSECCRYAATYDGLAGKPRWVPSIHMPRWASRISLVVTATKIEPLWKISEEDAAAEGCEAGKLDDAFGPRDIGDGWTIESSGTWASAAGKFQILWNSLHGENAWDEAAQMDTEVVALTFTVHQANIDQLLAA